MYSFGLLLQELFTGKPPYDTTLDYTDLARQDASRRNDGRNRAWTRDLAALIERLKSTAPAQRPTAVEAAERLRWIRGKPKRRLIRLAA